MNRKAGTLPCRKLQELKKYPRKTSAFGQPRGHLIRVLNERRVNDDGDFCLLWLGILKSVFIGFVSLKFEIKQWFSTYQDQFCAWFSLARLATETARNFFLDHFLKNNGFIFLLLASRACPMPRQDFFCTLSFAQSRKTLS